MTREQIKTAVLSKGYAYFENGDYNVNIICIRNSSTGNKVTNAFDDYITISYKENGVWKYFEWNATTDPGTKSVINYENSLGVARLVPGQYRGSHIIKLHQGKYDALCQDKPVKVFRDKNKDLKYDENTITEGIYGINLHKAGTDSTFVDGWSAGCCVFKRVKDFDLFMSILRKAEKIHGNRFTVTLIKTEDII